jgi:hypothetical protein
MMLTAVFAAMIFSGTMHEQRLEARPMCEIATEWVEANSHALPGTLAELNGLELPYRRAVFRVMEPSEQLRLWQEHLKLQLTRDDLTEGQLALVEWTIAEASSFFESSDREAVLEEANERMVAEFSEEERYKARAIFATLGGTPAGESLAIGGCSCNTGSDFCGTPTSLDEDCLEGGCDEANWGCGWLWLQDCNGECEIR